MKERIIFSASIIIFLAIAIVEAAPNVTFNYQNPADLNLSNFLGPEGVNISYNITSPDLNLSIINLFYKSNCTQDNIFYYENGTAHSGFLRTSYLSNSSSSFLWRLFDNQVLPATYNFHERTMETTNHSGYTTLNSNGDYLFIELFNVSSRRYSFFEIMANRSSGSGVLRNYYCNVSYNSASNPASSPNCYEYYDLATNTYHHSHSNFSRHMIMPLAVNETSGMIGTVRVTSISYFLIRGINGNNWNAYYISNTSRTDAYKTSTNNGNAWTSQTYTIDAHLHQFGTNHSLWYYACANDTSNNENCTSSKQDKFELFGLPPTSPHIILPINISYKGNISVNYTASESPNGYQIAYYNISLLNQDFSFNLSIIRNNSANLSYWWDSSAITDGSYFMKVEVCDSSAQCSSGFSENFTIDSSGPLIDVVSPANSTSSTADAYNFTFTISDPTGIEECVLILDGSQINNLSYPSRDFENGFYNSSLAIGVHTWRINCTDSLGNTGSSEMRTLTISSSASVDSGGSSGGYPTFTPSESDLSLGYKKSLSEGWSIRLISGNLSEKITLKKYSSSNAEFLFSSNSNTKTLREKEELSFLFAEEEFLLKLEALNNSKALVLISHIQTALPENMPSDKEEVSSINESGQDLKSESEKSKSSPWPGLAITFLIILAFGIAIFLIIKIIKILRLNKINEKNSSFYQFNL